MRRNRTSTRAHVSAAAAFVSLAALTVSTGAAHGASGSAPPGLAGLATPRGLGASALILGVGSSGEGQLAGPATGPVDPAHATPAAARAAALAAHEHDHMSSMTSSLPRARAGAVSAAALNPAVYGRWTTLSYKLPLRTIHATLLRTGKFLLIAGSGNIANDQTIRNFKAYLWDPRTNGLTSVPVPYDAFCSGHLVDANGDVIVFGGTVGYLYRDGAWTGSNKAYKFNVSTSTWTALPSMKQARWYPTSVQDAKNRFLNYSGFDAKGAVPQTGEMYDPATRKWTPLASRPLPLYASLQLLKDGRLAYTGAYFGHDYRTVKPSVFNPLGTGRVEIRDPHSLLDPTHRNAAMSALVGSADKQLVWVAGGGFPALRSTYFIDFNAHAPTVVAGPRLGTAKGFVSISHLPDMTAFETGGGTSTSNPVYEASILNPSTRRLTAMAPPRLGRTYHSSAVTMPDGRVVTFGGDPPGDKNFELRIEIFSPPYLFKGARPKLTAAPTQIRYGGTYKVRAKGSGRLSAVLMRPGSATHSLDANQRVLALATKAVKGGVRVTLPRNRNLAPPGWYLLFVNDGAHRPSVGRWVHLS
ncbi:MAG: hypothetical protein JWQ67_88 [Marmoricola sp.]|jgi:hypothetical protein|nr:hypothetical protein [Marmoricola sp.]